MKTVHSEQFWRSLIYLNIYRLFMTVGIFLSNTLFDITSLGAYNPQHFFFTVLAYIFFCCISTSIAIIRYPNFDRQLALFICGDVIFLCIMIYTSGGIKSGLGVLLMVSLAGTGLISHGKLALFYVSIATIGILTQETFAVFYIRNYQSQYMQVGLLGLGYFAVTWMAHRLAVYAIINEQLAKQRGADLEKMLQINQLVIHDMQDGVLVVDRNGEIHQRNLFAENLIGLQPNAHTANLPKLADYIPELETRLETWYSNKDTKFDLLRLPSNNVLVRTRFVPIDGNDHTSAVIFLEDMSQIQSQVQQLKLAALGRLTANIAHEIRNPLSSISHAAELLEEGQKESRTHSRLLHIIRDNTQRLNKIVQDILQLNRRDVVQSEHIDIEKFLSTFITDFCLTEKINTSIFQLDITEINFITFDRGHLNQVLWNLCRNAWRYCRRKKGSILLRLANWPSENSIMLDVIDDGPGVSPVQIKQLFEPFYTTATGGTGLGLYIAREICEANNVSLEYIENSSGGHFRIILNEKSLN